MGLRLPNPKPTFNISRRRESLKNLKKGKFVNFNESDILENRAVCHDEMTKWMTGLSLLLLRKRTERFKLLSAPISKQLD